MPALHYKVSVGLHTRHLFCAQKFRPYNFCLFVSSKIWDSKVGTATGYGLGDLGSIPGRGKSFFSTPRRLDWLWGPPSLRGVKFTTHLHLVSGSRMVELHLRSPIRLYGVVLDLLNKHKDSLVRTTEELLEGKSSGSGL
jgi:hypothetical protein